MHLRLASHLALVGLGGEAGGVTTARDPASPIGYV